MLALYAVLRAVSSALGAHPLLNPVLWTAVALGGAIAALGIPLRAFLSAAEPLYLALDVAVTALAFPLVAQLAGRRRQLLAVLIALIAGGATAMGSAIMLAVIVGLPVPFVQALSVKSVSSGFAIALMERFGGPAPLAAGLVVSTGMIGALILPPLLRRLGFADAAMGLATGQAAHIVGTDSLLRSRPAAGAYAALAMAVSGLVGALLLPLFWRFIA